MVKLETIADTKKLTNANKSQLFLTASSVRHFDTSTSSVTASSVTTPLTKLLKVSELSSAQGLKPQLRSVLTLSAA